MENTIFRADFYSDETDLYVNLNYALETDFNNKIEEVQEKEDTKYTEIIKDKIEDYLSLS